MLLLIVPRNPGLCFPENVHANEAFSNPYYLSELIFSRITLPCGFAARANQREALSASNRSTQYRPQRRDMTGLARVHDLCHRIFWERGCRAAPSCRRVPWQTLAPAALSQPKHTGLSPRAVPLLKLPDRVCGIPIQASRLDLA